MGNTVPAGGAKAGPQPDLHVYLQEYPFLVFGGVLKGGKFLKSALFKSGEQGEGVIKVYRKPPAGTLGSVDLEAELKRISDRLSLIRGYLTLYEVRVVLLLFLSRNPCCVVAGNARWVVLFHDLFLFPQCIAGCFCLNGGSVMSSIWFPRPREEHFRRIIYN